MRLVPGRRYRVEFNDADGYFGGWFEAVFIRHETAVDVSGKEYITDSVFDTASIGGIDTCEITDVTERA